ncbi:MAG: translational GTPase TypA [Pseudomonadota bacterium]|nr:translational GTPase TypA [Pseudomonadota bacterium]
MQQEKIRNITIIAHVDHGKTTLVDVMFQQSGSFREGQEVAERLMDSMDLEKERGITIQAKNGSIKYKDHLINIIDTPGHADFGGEVERVMGMADGVVFLVDAAEGPMPQSYFVLKKAIEKKLPVIVMVNKLDKPAARPDWAVDQVFDLMVKLDAPDNIIDFPTIYGSAKEGFATTDPTIKTNNIDVLLDTIVDYVPSPKGDNTLPLQMQISSISYSSYLGRLAIGKLSQGQVKVGQEVAISTPEAILEKKRISKIYKFETATQVSSESASTGEIIAIAGLENSKIGQTITDPVNPDPLPATPIDPPTISMLFLPNDSPFAGLEGKFVTSRHLRERLMRELLADVALTVTDDPNGIGYIVSGRGELHLAILIEKMRREGYEFQVASPKVIFREHAGNKTEPYENLFIEVETDNQGKVMESLGSRKGEMKNMDIGEHTTKLHYFIPTRGLLGYYSQFMTETKGMGVMNSSFAEYGPFLGDIKTRTKGVAIVKETCTTVAYALFNLQDRIKLFLGPGIKVYEGQVIGENARDGDLTVNPSKGKKLTNVRASGSDDAVILTPPVKMSLERCISYIDDTELVEISPKNIRIRKKFLKEHERKRAK